MTLPPMAREAGVLVPEHREHQDLARRHAARALQRERCQVGPNDASWPMRSAGWEYSDEGLKLAQLLSQLGVFLTFRFG
jgi:hypothetical protein